MAWLSSARRLPLRIGALLHTTTAASDLTAIAQEMPVLDETSWPNYDGEYTGPKMKTAMPGPKSKVCWNKFLYSSVLHVL